MQRLYSNITSSPDHKLYIIAGAGISVSAGVPDFRSQNGLYNMIKQSNIKIEDSHHMFSSKYYQIDPTLFLDLAPKLWPGAENLKGELIKPTRFHLLLKLLSDLGRLEFLISQNIDSLEHEVGLPSDKYLLAHGDCSASRCPKCKTEFSFDYFRATILDFKVNPSVLPSCPFCGAFYKPKIVFFSEDLSTKFYEENHRIRGLKNCSLIIVGTSDAVEPVCNIKTVFPGDIFFVNPDSICLDEIRVILPNIITIKDTADNFALNLSNFLNFDLEKKFNSLKHSIDIPYYCFNDTEIVFVPFSDDIMPVATKSIYFEKTHFSAYLCTKSQIEFLKRSFCLETFVPDPFSLKILKDFEFFEKFGKKFNFLKKSEITDNIIDFYTRKISTMRLFNRIDVLLMKVFDPEFSYATKSFSLSKMTHVNLFAPHYSAVCAGYFNDLEEVVSQEALPLNSTNFKVFKIMIDIRTFMQMVPNHLLCMFTYQFSVSEDRKYFLLKLSGNLEYISYFITFIENHSIDCEFIGVLELKNLSSDNHSMHLRLEEEYCNEIYSFCMAKADLLELYKIRNDPIKTESSIQSISMVLENLGTPYYPSTLSFTEKIDLLNFFSKTKNLPGFTLFEEAYKSLGSLRYLSTDLLDIIKEDDPSNLVTLLKNF